MPLLGLQNERRRKMKYRKYRRCFWGVLFSFAVLDTVYDITALANSNFAHSAAGSLQHSVGVLRELSTAPKLDVVEFNSWLTRIQSDVDVTVKAGLNSRAHLFLANGLDLALLLAAAITWTFYERKRRKEDAAMAQVVQNAEKGNNNLVKLLSQRSSQLRTTVHDLKNPLSSIMGYSELISLDCNNPVSVSEKCEVMRRISDHTLELVNSLVENEEHRQNMAPRLMNLNAYIEDVCLAFMPQSQKKHQRFVFEFAQKNMQVSAHPRKVYDLLMNLIGNAMKFSPANTRIRIRTKLKNGKAMIEVEDEGPGFSRQDKLHAFELFKTLTAKPTGGEQSTGLGLSIAREIVEFHGGGIRIEDAAIGSGACIVVELPT